MKEKPPHLWLFQRLTLLLIIMGLGACAHFDARDDARYQGGTGDLGLIIERTEGSVLLINTSQRQVIQRISGLGDLSHASIVYSRDQRFGYVFGRDGGLSKVDLLRGAVVKRVIQAGNSIGGAISQNGAYVAVSNYDPGGVNIFNSEDLALVASIPSTSLLKDGVAKGSKTVGLVDAPNNRFVVSLFDSDEVWILDMTDSDPAPGLQPQIAKFTAIGRQPYDALITPEGRYYLAGLFGDNGMAKLDLWRPQEGVTRIMPTYGPGEQRLPVYKMPHLEGWTQAGRYLFAPGVGHHEVIVIDSYDWRIVRRIPTYSQPVFVMAQPDARRVWVNFAHPDNDRVQVIDVDSLQVINTIEAGKAVLHMAFTPKGDQLWISLRDDNRVDIYDPYSMQRISSLPARHPSGIFFTDRAHRIGL
ncbi:cytochrome D1 domain-containing protein [Hahella aquimaris]|uniref:cytochrome D1 domain-containing protein n=1 Tax=Hahella sp. HNIBRBA332 TaxID=3015983 RepID=UPI00273C94E1|nr:cytochrome D1 domain-containing protein [Hahella sp. HNIBRBA332]WLQ17261.1 cytochrome D1 domain-containing protein [Hahella sp. HNIBRBA332]